MVPIKLANLLAKNSCSKWNRRRLLRVLCRYGYRMMAKYYAKHPIQINRYEHELHNDYPWPYSDPRFASWEEDDGALITDPANFVIRHSTSYCAWRINELTGEWPTNRVILRDDTHAQEIARRERPRDARYWLEFLQAQNCFIEVVDDITTINRSDYYIGINPNYGEFGLIVWFEYLFYDHDTKGTALISTYENKQYVCKEVLLTDFTWVKIGKKAAR